MKDKLEKTAYVLDFDGTVTAIDTSTELASNFGGREYAELEEAYLKREFGMKEWLVRVGSFLPADLDHLTLLSLEMAVLRPGFKDFLHFARSHNRQIYIASDGLGFYIEPVLRKFGCLELIDGVFKNKTIVDGGKIRVIVNSSHHGCEVCGNCKASHVVKLKQKGLRIIYVGDGMNDRFGASWADRVFARDRLARCLRESGFPFTPWADFYDLIKSADPGARSDTPVPVPLCNPVIMD